MVKIFKKNIILIGIIWILCTWSITLWDDKRFDWIDSFWQNITWATSWINTIWTSWTNAVWEWNGYTLLDTIQNAINRILWMLSFVALVLCLRGWFQMLTAAWDDWKVKSWTKILKNAAIGLAVIWLSWLVVSFVFWIINKVSA